MENLKDEGDTDSSDESGSDSADLNGNPLLPEGYQFQLGKVCKGKLGTCARSLALALSSQFVDFGLVGKLGLHRGGEGRGAGVMEREEAD